MNSFNSFYFWDVYMLNISKFILFIFSSRKRTNKGIVVPPVGPSTSEDHYWDCSVCTFRNNAEAFKCSMCDVRKGTSTRKPRINPDLVASQQAQALTPPPPSTTPTPSSSNSVQLSGDEGGTPPGSSSVLADEETETAALASLKSNKKVREPKTTKKKEPGVRKSTANTWVLQTWNSCVMLYWQISDN